MNSPHDMDRTALAPRGEDPTSAYGWASSPLGDPTDPHGDRPSGHEFPSDPIAPAARAKSIDKVMVAAGLIGVIGAGTALGIALFSSSPQPQAVAVAPGSTAAPAAASTFATLAPVPAAVAAPVAPPPDNGPAPVVALPDDIIRYVGGAAPWAYVIAALGMGQHVCIQRIEMRLAHRLVVVPPHLAFGVAVAHHEFIGGRASRMHTRTHHQGTVGGKLAFTAPHCFFI